MPDKNAPVIVVKKSRLKVTVPDVVPAKVCPDAVTAETSAREAKPLNKQARRNRDSIALFARTFPALWPEVDKGKFRPMKVGIREQVKAYIEASPDCGMTFSQWIRAVRVVVSRIEYQRCLKEGAVRYDIHGKAAGVVTAEDAADARIRVAKIRAKFAARRGKRNHDTAE